MHGARISAWEKLRRINRKTVPRKARRKLKRPKKANIWLFILAEALVPFAAMYALKLTWGNEVPAVDFTAGAPPIFDE